MANFDVYVVVGQFMAWDAGLQRNIVMQKAYEVKGKNSTDAEKHWHEHVIDGFKGSTVRKVLQVFGPYISNGG